MVRNFKDHAVTYPGRYLAGMEVPAFGSVAALITWLNENPQMVLSPDFGAIIQAGTKNNAENLNEAQKDSLIYLPATRTNGGLVDRYVHSAAELDAMFINPACGIFGAKALFVPSASNTLAAPVIKVGETDFTICIANTPVGVNYLHANKCYLMLLDVGVQKANLVQLEITNSDTIIALTNRVTALETIKTRREYLGRRLSPGWGSPAIWTLPKQHQFVTIIAGSTSDSTAAAGTYMDLSNASNLTYLVEIYEEVGIWYIRAIIENDTGPSVEAKIEVGASDISLYLNENIGPDAFIAFTEIVID